MRYEVTETKRNIPIGFVTPSGCVALFVRNIKIQCDVVVFGPDNEISLDRSDCLVKESFIYSHEKITITLND